MTKIYLVYLVGISETNDYLKNVWAVFTNKRKAENYCRYKKEITDQKWLEATKMRKADWVVETERIWTEDYSFRLKQIQAEKLPF